MKVAIHYFSGCGNVAWVVEEMQRELLKKGHHVLLCQNIENALPTEIPATDVDFFVSPTYFFGLPVNFLNYLKRLAIVAGRHAIFLSVSGGVSGISQSMAEYFLKDKGYDVIGLNNIVMPDTFLFLKQSQISEKEKQNILKQAKKEIGVSIGFLDVLPSLPKKNIFASVGFFLVYSFYYFVLRHVLGLGFVSTSKCSNCGWCEEHCPAHAIAFKDGKPIWNTGCIGCFRCVNGCPVHAIDFSMYSVFFGLVGAVGGGVILGSIFDFLGAFAKFFGFFFGWFLGAFVFQKVSVIFSRDKMLCFSDKKRINIKTYKKDL